MQVLIENTNWRGKFGTRHFVACKIPRAAHAILQALHDHTLTTRTLLIRGIIFGTWLQYLRLMATSYALHDPMT